MSYEAKVFKVMIASPGDVHEERQIIREVIYDWNTIHSEVNRKVLLPVGWETHSAPEMGGRPQAIINEKILKDCDILVAAFWTRIGSSTGKAISGSVEEIEEHLKTGKLAMLYFSTAPVRPNSIDSRQYKTLQKFKKSCQSRGLYEGYDSVEDFRAKFQRQLQIHINQHPLIREEIDFVEIFKKAVGQMPELSTNAKELLENISRDNDGELLVTLSHDGMRYQTNEREIDVDSSRKRADLEDAIRELINLEYIFHAARSVTDQIYRLTKKGYDAADSLHLSE